MSGLRCARAGGTVGNGRTVGRDRRPRALPFAPQRPVARSPSRGVTVSEITEALSYDDVLLTPQASAVLPRDVDVSTRLHPSIELRLPLLSAAMDKVTEAAMAVALARQGGLGVIHKNASVADQAAMVESVKRSESGFIVDPVTLGPDDAVDRAFELMARYRVSGFPVVDGEGRLLGIVTNRDLRLGAEYGTPISQYMTTEGLVTAVPGTTLDQARDRMQDARVEKLPIVDPDTGKLTGMFTFKDIEKVRMYPAAAKDARGRLLAAAAVGVGPDGEERAEALVAAGVDLLAIDSAHGHSAGILEFAAKLKDRHPDVPLMVGNVATGDAVRACADHGADVVKVGVGPGSICTTRVVTGVGMPQFTAVMEAARAAAEVGVATIADGGVRYSGDIVKALAVGANAVMVGNILAGTDESPGELVLAGGRRYKEYRGMGSIDAMRAGSADRYFQADRAGGSAAEARQQPTKLVPEGVSGLLPYRGSVAEVTGQLEGGLRSGMGYVGAVDLPSLVERARFVKQTAAGTRESHVHDVDVVNEAPNYQAPGSGGGGAAGRGGGAGGGPAGPAAPPPA
ncbi:MAG: IMP dehydrogenase, partial [Nitriliruptoraceae bacterium]|nr:IMP dehydrogenase [Nitriliruptoraceae bacterium]